MRFVFNRALLILMSCTLMSSCQSPDSESPSNHVGESAPMAASEAAALSAPIAARQDHPLTAHGETRNDPYYWLRDDERESAAVLEYLNAENSYTQSQLAPVSALRESLFKEMSARLRADDSSVPYRDGNAWFARRYEAGKDQPIHVWWPQAGEWPDGEPSVLLDENQLGAGLDFYQIGNYAVSPDQRWLAWTEDTVSRGIFQIRLRRLDGSEADASANEVISGVSPDLAFADDGETLFYLRLQDDTLIPWQLWRHKIGTDPAEDVLVYQEEDPSYFNNVERSGDGHWIVLTQVSTTTSEVQVIPSAAPTTPPRAVIPRQRGHEYQADFLGNLVYILSNEGAPNFRLVSAPLEQAADRSQWQELLPENPQALLQELLVLRNYVVVEEISNAIQALRVLPSQGGESHLIAADEAAYVSSFGANLRADTDTLRYVYSSPTTPATVYDLNLASGERVKRKQEFAGENFDPARYEVTRLNITARDGTQVPVTLLHQRGAQPDGQKPLYLLGYGSYGFSYLPNFTSELLSLVDRGFVTGIAHIRGGQEQGRHWYDEGRLLHKKNTFTDFIDATRALVKAGWAHPQKVAASGRSAGGLLIGAVANMAPQDYAVLIAGVPFVDVVTTMLDESIPLTTYEYDEWGNPNDAEYYRYMLSYSPYDNVHQGPYPDILVTTGLWDPAVQYWEPAKWVAKLRVTKQDDRKLLLYVDMTAGHRGGSGRYDRLNDRAMEYAFILERLGLVTAP